MAASFSHGCANQIGVRERKQGAARSNSSVRNDVEQGTAAVTSRRVGVSHAARAKAPNECPEARRRSCEARGASQPARRASTRPSPNPNSIVAPAGSCESESEASPNGLGPHA